MTIKAVCFDLDDTLLWDEKSVSEAFHAVCVTAQEKQGLNPEKLEEAVRRQARKLYESYETFEFTRMIGINPFEGLWARFTEGDHAHFRRLHELVPDYRKESWTRGLQELGVDDPELGEALGEMFAAERRARPLVYEETFAVLDALKEHYQLLLLTNGSPDLQKEKITAFPQLSSYFEHIVISGEFGEGKPSASIFKHALQLLEVTAAQAVMVGDKLTTDILGSSRAGIPNVWINRKGQPRTGDIVPNYEINNLKQLIELLPSL